MKMESGNKQEDVSLESILSRLKLGPYYLRFICLYCVTGLTSEMYFVNFVFAAADVDYTCKYPQCETDSNDFEKTRNLTTYLDLGRCHRYELLDLNGSCSLDNFNTSRVVKCEEWVYEEPDSFVAYFHLGCQDWRRTLVGTMHAVGYMMGLLIVGPFSDKMGRKMTVVLIAVSGGVMGLARSVTSSYWVYIVLELMEAAIGDSCSPMYTYVVEMATKENRVLFTSIFQVSFALSELLLAIIAWQVPYWRHLLRVMYAPALMFLLYWFVLDESPRWLLSKGRKPEAIAVLKKIAKFNNVHVEEDTFDRLKFEAETTNTDLMSLLKKTVASKKLLRRFLGCVCMWIICSFNYEALVINSVSLQGNKYLNFGLLALMYLIASLSLFYILAKFKRRIPLLASFLLTGMLCVAQPFVPKDYKWTATMLFLGGRLTSCISFPTVYLYTSELFPTQTRNTMHALCSALGRIGGILGPQTPLLTQYWSGLPALLIGGLALTASLISWLMPDAADDTLPDTVLQAEAVGFKQAMILKKSNDFVSSSL